MALYTIRDLEKLSGIKAHTIRIWELRYNLIEPGRTETNIRRYSDEDLKRLINVSILNQNGYKISKIALMKEDEISALAAELSASNPSLNTRIENLIAAMLELDESRFFASLDHATAENGFEFTVEQLIFPFLERIGQLWLAGSIYPAQEHFISSLIRQKMIAAIDREMSFPVLPDQRMVFFLSEGETHELGLLYYSYLARKSGLEVIYLGASVPHIDLVKLSQIKPFNYLFTSFITAIGMDALTQRIGELHRDFPGTTILVSGWQIKEHQPSLPSNFKKVASSSDFKQALLDR